MNYKASIKFSLHPEGDVENVIEEFKSRWEGDFPIGDLHIHIL